MDTLYTTRATASDGRNGKVSSPDGRLHVALSHPLQTNRPETGTDPEQLFGAAYAACYGSALELAAQLLGLPWHGPATVESTVELFMRPGGGFNIRVELVPILKALNAEQAQKLVEKAHSVCPYSYALRNNVEVVTRVDAG